ncbi:helix-turn-helix domain-containing protein [Halomonas sp. AOP12-C2-37]|uniref:helix-turn-helix domain-containing protein n=1 Tax=unclassified Halomonas TaxID=2609666 RepID=UPI004033FE13
MWFDPGAIPCWAGISSRQWTARGRTSKLDDRQVREIRTLLSDPDVQVAEVARRYCVSRTTLYKHVGIVTPRR